MACPICEHSRASMCSGPEPSAAIMAGSTASAAARSQRDGRVMVGIVTVPSRVVHPIPSGWLPGRFRWKAFNHRGAKAALRGT